ncbi:MAG: class II aldolase/adducin family protein [Acidobacteriia bacterium]|nr:class II aldolase/adducin family protein [Terriglobia bacterium]
MKSERQHREDIVRFGRMLHQRGYVAATDGNLSVRLDHETVLSTPTGMSKGMLEPEDLVVVDMTGKRVTGRRQVSSEIGMHLLIYSLRPDTHGIVHAHPPTATGYAAAGLPLNQALVSEIVLSLGCIPLARYATPGTPELVAALEPLVPVYDAILMANHGVVTCGEDLTRAYMKMETVEHFAQITLVTHLLGRQQLLTQDEVSQLIDARERYGLSGPAKGTAACPVTAGAALPPSRESAPAVSFASAKGGEAPKPQDGSGKITVTREELAAIVEDALRQTGKRRW